MPSFFSKFIVLLVFSASLFQVFAEGETLAEKPPSQGRKFSVPLRDRDGTLLWLLTGDSAKQRSDGKAEIEKVVLEHYNKQNVDWTLVTPNCIFDSSTKDDDTSKKVVSDAEVQIHNENIDINGKGFIWLSTLARFIIRNEVNVIIPERITEHTSPEASKSTTTIQSNSLDLDYGRTVGNRTERLATFTGNVIATDPKLKLTCKEMDVFFEDKKNEAARTAGDKASIISRVVARDDVHMYTEEKEGRGDKAVYTPDTRVLLLSGSNPQIEDKHGNRIISRGDSIIYNTKTKQLDVNKPTVEMRSVMDSRLENPNAPQLLYAANTPVKKIETDASSTPTKPFTKIDSDVLNFDYDQHIAVFEGNVVAIDTQLTLKCKTLKIFFTENNKEVVRAEAYSNVYMVTQGKEAFGDTAVFTKETNLLVLTGENARFKDKSGIYASRGDGIVYNTLTKDMKIDKPALQVQPSSGKEILSPQKSNK